MGHFWLTFTKSKVVERMVGTFNQKVPLILFDNNWFWGRPTPLPTISFSICGGSCFEAVKRLICQWALFNGKCPRLFPKMIKTEFPCVVFLPSFIYILQNHTNKHMKTTFNWQTVRTHPVLQYIQSSTSLSINASFYSNFHLPLEIALLSQADFLCFENRFSLCL